MAKFTTTLTGTTDDNELLKVISPREYAGYGVTLFAKGTEFDGGTITIQVSPDGGTTKFTAKDTNGADVTFTANGYTNILLGNGAKNGEHITVFADLSGASGSADVEVIAFDVRFLTFSNLHTLEYLYELCFITL